MNCHLWPGEIELCLDGTPSVLLFVQETDDATAIYRTWEGREVAVKQGINGTIAALLGDLVF